MDLNEMNHPMFRMKLIMILKIKMLQLLMEWRKLYNQRNKSKKIIWMHINK